MSKLLLKSTRNRYQGIYVAPEDLPKSDVELKSCLEYSLRQWTEENVQVVWIKIPIKKSMLLPIVYAIGFENHHCENDWIMLTKRLQADAIIPSYAKHTIGVGGLVINQQHQVLSIREKAHIVTHPHNWKFPGGMLDPYEHFEQGVIREVFEETGITCLFKSFIGFRHHHQGQFSTSNIYAVCRLEPTSHKISIQESEISDARWFPIDEYLADEKIGQYNKQILSSALKFRGLQSVNLPGYMASVDDYEVFLSC